MANITIVGAGNAGCANACYLTSLGHSVTIFKSSRSVNNSNFDEISKMGGMYLTTPTTDHEVFIKFSAVTKDPKAAFKDCDYVFVFTQSLQHESVANLICDYIHGIRGLIITPGNLGSVFFRQRLPESVFICECESTVVDARILSPGHVQILFQNVRNAISFNPARDASLRFKEISEVLPNYTHLRTNIIETAMHNPNLVVHTIGTLMSAARIEYSKGEFWLYKEGFSPSIWNLVEQLDEEKNKVIEAFGGKALTYLECCRFRNEKSETVDPKEVFENYAQNGSPKGPATINNRYLTEDIPNGLFLLSQLGEKANVKTPLADALITLGSVMLKSNLSGEGRSLKKLGWEDLSLTEIVESLS